MVANDKIWIVLGVVLIVSASSLLYLPGVMSPLVPMPMHMVILAWILSHGFIAIMPALYLAVLLLLGKSKRFGKVVFVSALLLAVLDVIWFYVSWDYGLRWQGQKHTIAVATENLLGLVALISLSWYGLKMNSIAIQKASNLFMFLLLSWCIFPYFGELP